MSVFEHNFKSFVQYIRYPVHYSPICTGFSMMPWNSLSHVDASCSSTALPSQHKVTVVTFVRFWFNSFKQTCVLPTARTPACCGGMIAVKFFIPNIPRFEMVNEPPCTSWSWSWPSLACSASPWKWRFDIFYKITFWKHGKTAHHHTSMFYFSTS